MASIGPSINTTFSAPRSSPLEVSRSRSNVVTVLSFVLALAGASIGCSKDRAAPLGQVACISWKDEVETLMTEECVRCHGAENASGAYRLDDYAWVLEGGSDDEPNAVSGEGSSKLLRVIAPDEADDVHRPFVDAYERLRTWVVDCRLSYRASLLHEGGLMNPRDPAFHGQLLRDFSYDLDVCAGCHGSDFGGGSSGASCLRCHEKGPRDCETCHSRDEVLASLGHRAHLEAGKLGKVMECRGCHLVPERLLSPGHVVRVDGQVDAPPAEVVLSGLAALAVESDPSRPRPSYDPVTRTCAHVYCHGDTFADVDAGGTRPEWRSGLGQAECGQCHGLPPRSHTHEISACEICHETVVGPDRTLVDVSLHLDGRVQVGREEAGCASCHGSATSYAPPPSLEGAISTSVTAVGAHQAHLEGTQRLRGPMPCSDCHLVPEVVSSSGHIDTPLPAEVFPATILESTLGAADGAMPIWDRDTGRCSDVYCHGGGIKLGSDASPSIRREPTWTRVGRQEVVCGSCHGVPPARPPHTATMRISDCMSCHPRVVDRYGNILFSSWPDPPVSEHIDGDVDLF